MAMTSSRAVRLLLITTVTLAALAIYQWRDPEADGVASWLAVGLAGTTAATLITALVGRETRPRTMLRFLAALCALIAAIALVAELTRDDGVQPMTLLDALMATMPSLIDGLKAFVSTHLSPLLWSPVLTSLIDQPTWLVFAVAALSLAYAGRPLRRVEIFVN